MIADVNRLENAARLAMGHVPSAPSTPAVRSLSAPAIFVIAGLVAVALGSYLVLT